MGIETQTLTWIYAALHKSNGMRVDAVKLENDPETKLLGNLDSLAMVNFLVALEDTIEEKLLKPISLVNGFDLPADQSPFQTIGTLANYIESLIGSKRAQSLQSLQPAKF